MSKLTKKQTKQYIRTWTEDHKPHKLVVEVRHDDNCNNGHNSFAITADLYIGRRLDSCGCQHDLVVQHVPELAPFIKWHLTSTDGPMHYIANTVYHAENDALDYARSSAVWPGATKEQLLDKAQLTRRLPQLMAKFQTDIESLGLVY